MAYIKDLNGLEETLMELSSISCEAVIKKSLTQMFNRAAAEPYTPIVTGELKMSRKTEFVKGKQGVFGYTKDYAPHVEYGHRLTNGGYVQGQYYLKRNWEIQQPILKDDIRNQIGKVLK